jgi:hypothetical protein
VKFGLLSFVAFVIWAIISVVRSIADRPFGPATDTDSETEPDSESLGADTDANTETDDRESSQAKAPAPVPRLGRDWNSGLRGRDLRSARCRSADFSATADRGFHFAERDGYLP